MRPLSILNTADSLERTLPAKTSTMSDVAMKPPMHILWSGPEKGVITKGVFSLEESLESLKSLNSLKSLDNGRSLLCFPQSGDSLESLESLNSLESLENGLFWKDPFSKRPLFPNPIWAAAAHLGKNVEIPAQWPFEDSHVLPTACDRLDISVVQSTLTWSFHRYTSAMVDMSAVATLECWPCFSELLGRGVLVGRAARVGHLSTNSMLETYVW